MRPPQNGQALKISRTGYGTSAVQLVPVGLVLRGSMHIDWPTKIVITKIVVLGLDDRFHESCHNVGIHVDFSDSHIGHV
jgi:hypothetical protein